MTPWSGLTWRDGEWRDAPDILIQPQAMIEGWMGALGAIKPLAHPAGDTDIGGAPLALGIHGIAIDQMLGLAHVAADGNGKTRAAAAMTAEDGINRAGHG